MDNGSTDESRQVCAGQCEFHSLDSNHGFAFAVNRGIEAADTEFVAILNNDIVLEPEWLACLETSLAAPDIHFACPTLLSGRHPDMLDGTFDLLTRSGCALRVLHGAPATHPDAAHPRDIQFAPMTAALFRRDLFVTIGLLDEDFGSYLEDVEFGLRAAARGYRGRFVPAAQATHLGSATLGQWSSRSTYLIARNQIYVLARHFPPELLRAWWWPILAGNLLFLALSFKHRRGFVALRAKLRALLDWRSIRGPGTDDRRVPGTSSQTQRQAIEAAITHSEQELLSLARDGGVSRFWQLYFGFVSFGRSSTRSPRDNSSHGDSRA